MKNQKSLYQSILGVLLVTLFILFGFWSAMYFTDEVNWSVADFLIMGTLLFVTGSAFVLVVHTRTNLVYRIAMAIAIGTSLLMIWANLAVGLIGAGPNPGNFMYIGVLAVAAVGAVRAGFRPAGMERAMYATAISLVLVALIALVAGMQHYAQSSVGEILGVNLFFASPFALAGLLFRHVSHEEEATEQKA